MNKKAFPLSFFNIFLTFVIFIIISSSLILLSYFNTQKMLDKNMNDYFKQTLNIVKIVFNDEKKDLNTLSSNLSNNMFENENINKQYIFNLISEMSIVDDLDLVYVKTKSTLLDFSNSLFDTKNIINKIEKDYSLGNRNFFLVNIDNKNYLVLLNEKEIVDKKTGRILATFYIGKIYNNNLSFINSLKMKTEIKNISIFLNEDLIISSMNSNSLFLSDFKNNKIKKQKHTISSKREFKINNNISLDIIFESENSLFADLNKTYLQYSYVLLITMFIFILFIYFLGNKVVVKPLNDLLDFAKNLKNDSDITYNSGVKEYNDLAKNLKTTINELKDVKEKYSEAIDGVQDGFWNYNLKNKEAFFSKKFKEMLGYEENNTLNIGFWKRSIFPSDKKRTFRKLNNHFKKKTEIYEDTYRLKCKDNTYKWIRVRAKAFFDKKGKVYKITGFHTDINDFKILQEENIKNEKILYQQTKLASMGEMIANIAHQWRQPLNLISTLSSSMQIYMHLGKVSQQDLYRDLDKINDTVEYLSQIIEKFRNFFHPSNDLEVFNLKNVLLENIEIFESSFKKSEVKFILNLDDTIIKAHKVELMQVLINLIKNASDALSENKIKNKLIFIHSYKKDETLFLEVYDNALGINHKLQDKIYEPYFSTKGHESGTGIGLYMSLQIIEKQFFGKLYNYTHEFVYKNETYVGEKFIIELDLKKLKD